MNVDQSVRIPAESTGLAGRWDAADRPVVDIAATSGWAGPRFGELWAYRELLGFLVWRDLKVHYKQTALGVGWVILQPLVATLIFTLIFGFFVRFPSGSLPYPVFAFSGFLPWNYFASVLTRSGTSLVNNSNLITKVYFPRLLVPLAGALNGLVDLLVGFVVLLLLMPLFGVTPALSVVFLPLLVLLMLFTALGVSLWLSALDVQYRDVKHVLPFLTQVWMYACPIIYPSSLIPERWHFVYGLNPMVGAVEGFRWALTGHGDPPIALMAQSALIGLLLLVSGAMFFRRTERTFADTI